MEMLEKFKRIKAFVFDIDGVLTEGRVLVTEEGHMLRTVNIKDGYALQHAVKQGYPIAIISGGNSTGMKMRFEGLGINHIYLGQSHKEDAFHSFINKYELNTTDILYMGDDIPDLPLLRIAGIGACPSDAATDVRQICTYISPVEGGKGCVREVIEKVMKLQGTWWNSDSHHW